MDKTLENMIREAYLECTVPNPKSNFDKFHNYVKILEKLNNFMQGKGKVAADNPLDPLNHHVVTVAWENDVLDRESIKEWASIISLADELVTIGDNKGNISTVLSVYDCYSESDSE